MNRNRIEYIRHPAIPDDLLVGVRRNPAGEEAPTLQRQRIRERRGGRELLADMVREAWGHGAFHIEGAENSKPVGIYEGEPVEVSISHSRWLICAALSRGRRVGVDLEPLERERHPLLLKRILHPEETPDIAALDVLRLWSMKEAILKWEGSGLRMAMNRVRIVRERDDDGGDDAVYLGWLPEDRSVRICSFTHLDHWLAVAWSGE